MTNSAWQERKENVFARGMGNIFPIFAERAQNAEVWDVEGLLSLQPGQFVREFT